MHPDVTQIIIEIILGYGKLDFNIRKFGLDSFKSPRPKASQDSIYRNILVLRLEGITRLWETKPLTSIVTEDLHQTGAKFSDISYKEA